MNHDKGLTLSVALLVEAYFSGLCRTGRKNLARLTAAFLDQTLSVRFGYGGLHLTSRRAWTSFLPSKGLRSNGPEADSGDNALRIWKFAKVGGRLIRSVERVGSKLPILRKW